MTADSTHLASLMCSRLCHDLMSPVGGMNNGVELLEDEPDPAMREQCVDLIAQGARRTAAKLRFFRLAFGAAGGFDAEIPVAELRELTEAMAAEARDVSVDWSVVPDTLPKDATKVLLNLSLIGIEALPRGGTLAVAAEDTGEAHEIALRAEGPRIAFDADIGSALDGDTDLADLTAHSAPAALIRLVAKDCGGGVQHARGESALVLGAVLPRRSG